MHSRERLLVTVVSYLATAKNPSIISRMEMPDPDYQQNL